MRLGEFCGVSRGPGLGCLSEEWSRHCVTREEEEDGKGGDDTQTAKANG